MTRREFMASKNIIITDSDMMKYCPSDFGMPNDTSYCDTGCDKGAVGCWEVEMSDNDIAEAEEAMNEPYMEEALEAFRSRPEMA